MARFLSPEWFEQVRAGTPPEDAGDDAVVLAHVVTGAPGGDVHYHVVLAGERAWIEHGSDGAAAVTFRSDWSTAVAIARGELSTQAALLAGRMRVSGNVALLASAADRLVGKDPVPASVRASTGF